MHIPECHSRVASVVVGVHAFKENAFFLFWSSSFLSPYSALYLKTSLSLYSCYSFILHLFSSALRSNTSVRRFHSFYERLLFRNQDLRAREIAEG